MQISKDKYATLRVLKVIFTLIFTLNAYQASGHEQLTKELINLGEVYERYVISSSSFQLEGGYTFVAPTRIGFPQFEWNQQEIFDDRITCEAQLLQRACKYSSPEKNSTETSCEFRDFGENLVARQVFELTSENNQLNVSPHLVIFHSCIPMQIIVYENGPFDPFE